jgi:transposase-like protein
MSHANARTNMFARRLIVERVAAGWPTAHVAEQLGVSRATVYKWLRRYAEGGDAALADRSSRPIRMPNRTNQRVEHKALVARRRLQAWCGRARRRTRSQPVNDPTDPGSLPRAASWCDGPDHRGAGACGAAQRQPLRAPRARSDGPVDVKKLGHIPSGGGWRLHGRRRGLSCQPAQEDQDRLRLRPLR